MTSLDYFLCVAAGCHVSIQTVGQRAVAELEVAMVVDFVRTDSVSVWAGILLSDTNCERRVSSLVVLV